MRHRGSSALSQTAELVEMPLVGSDGLGITLEFPDGSGTVRPKE